MSEISDSRTSSKYEALLKEYGYEIRGVYDNTVFFKSDGFGYSLSFDNGAGKYLAVGFGISGDYDELPIEKKYMAIQYVAENIKFVKAYFEEGSVQYSCEQIIYDSGNLNDIIKVSIDAMRVAHRKLTSVLSGDE